MAKIHNLNDFTLDHKLGLYTRIVTVQGYEIVEAKENSVSKEVRIISIAKNGKEFSLYQSVFASRFARRLLKNEGEICGIVVDIKRPESTADKIIGIANQGEEFFPSYFTFKDLNDREGINTAEMEQVVGSVELNQEIQFYSKDSAGTLFQFFSTPIGKNREGEPIVKDYGSYSVHTLWRWKNGRPCLEQVLVKSRT